MFHSCLKNKTKFNKDGPLHKLLLAGSPTKFTYICDKTS